MPRACPVSMPTDSERIDYLERHEVATELHDEFGCAYCVSRDDGIWEKRKTLREAVDAAISHALHVNDRSEPRCVP